MLGARTTIGIDLGTYDVKVVEVQNSRAGPRIVEAVRLPFPAPTGGSPEDREEQVEDVLRTFFGEGPLRGVNLAICVPMGWSTVRTIDLPPASEEDVSRIVHFEAESHIPLPLDDVELDHALIRSNGSTEAVIAACRKNLIAARLLPLERLNLRPNVVDVSSLAAVRCLAWTGEMTPPQAIVDLGASATEMTILDGRGWPRLARSFSTGGNALTEAMAQDLGLDFDEAEIQKKQTGLFGTQARTYQEGLAAMPTADQWASHWIEELRRSIQAFRASPEGKALERILLIGGGAGTIGLSDLLQDRLDIQVVRGQPWALLDVAGGINEPDHLFAVATGLALHAHSGPLAVNLLPRAHVQFRRTSRQQTSLRWLALITLTVGVMGSLVTHWSLQGKEAQRKDLEKSITQLEERLSGEIGRVKNLDERLTLLRELRRDIEGRSNWLEILRQTSIQIPESVSLSDLSFDKNRAAIFKGEAVSSAAVADVLEVLRGVSPFEDAKLDYIHEAKVGDQSFYEFQITCTLPAEEKG